jgi:hypothetical protein
MPGSITITSLLYLFVVNLCASELVLLLLLLLFKFFGLRISYFEQRKIVSPSSPLNNQYGLLSRQVYQLGGICKLVDLLRSPNQNVQQAAAGALRNLVFRSTPNKLETRRQNGIREAVSLLRRSGSTEIQKQLTGRVLQKGNWGGGWARW